MHLEADPNDPILTDAKHACWMAALCVVGGNHDRGVDYLWDAACALNDRRADLGAKERAGIASATSPGS